MEGTISAPWLNITATNLALSGNVTADGLVPAELGQSSGTQTLYAVAPFGGSHAGASNDGCGPSTSVPSTYGYRQNPDTFGSSGGNVVSSTNPDKVNLGGKGGGKVRIVADTIDLDGGSITSDGSSGSCGVPQLATSGGGSGGSVNILAREVTGFGRISVDGANATNSGSNCNSQGNVGGGGAGGRVAVQAEHISRFLEITAEGGFGGCDTQAEKGSRFIKGKGCTVPDALNFNPNADEFEASCEHSTFNFNLIFNSFLTLDVAMGC